MSSSIKGLLDCGIFKRCSKSGNVKRQKRNFSSETIVKSTEVIVCNVGVSEKKIVFVIIMTKY